MKRYKHKKIGYIAEERKGDNVFSQPYHYYHLPKYPHTLSVELIENSLDWEEVKEEYPIGTKINDSGWIFVKNSDNLWEMSSRRETYTDKEVAERIKSGFAKVVIEEKKPEYTILAFQSTKNNCYNEEFGENGFSIFKNNRRFWIDDRLNILHWNIYSVRRESDGEVFTVGDKVGKYKSITEFNVVDNPILEVKIIDYEPGSCEGYNFAGISFISKYKPEKLFTTEDGVDIYEGDRFYYLANSMPLDTYPISKIGDMTAAPGSTAANAHKRFSTKEKAEEYILNNKLLFSLKDMLSVRLNGLYKDQIITLAKSKLK